MSLVPPDLSTGFALLLVATSFVTSALTAGLGIGGGVALLAVMAYGMPVAALIPVHGVVQIGSNLGRFVVQNGMWHGLRSPGSSPAPSSGRVWAVASSSRCPRLGQGCCSAASSS